VYPTVMESDEVYPSGRTEGATRPGRTWKKPKDLSGCESEDRGSNPFQPKCPMGVGRVCL
jgi:hypothetical protein